MISDNGGFGFSRILIDDDRNLRIPAFEFLNLPLLSMLFLIQQKNIRKRNAKNIKNSGFPRTIGAEQDVSGEMSEFENHVTHTIIITFRLSI